MYSSWVLALPEGVTASLNDHGALQISGWGVQVELRDPPAESRAAIEQIASSGGSIRELTRWFQDCPPGDLARFLRFVKRLAGQGLVCFECRSEGGTLATLVPTAPTLDLSADFRPEGCYALSRFAYLHRVDDLLVLESPLAAARVIVEDDRVAAVLPALTTPATVEEFSQRLGFLSQETATSLLAMLDTAGLLTRVNDSGGLAEDDHQSLRLWEFHDLVFHTRSRLGRHDRAVGATLPWCGVIDPPTALRPTYPGEPVSLYCPDVEELKATDPSFAAVSEQRRSAREYGRTAISVKQLGEFLHRVARVTNQHDDVLETPGESVTVRYARRPYPCAGALYELEIYPVVQRCEGLAPGVYHHEPLEHGLYRLPTDSRACERLLDCASLRAMVPCEEIQVLLIYSARFPRMSWKYTGVAYAEIQKDVGVLMHSMYLAATAMGLAPCALGLGDSDIFAKAINSDYYAETSVGEFLLGSLPDQPGQCLTD